MYLSQGEKNAAVAGLKPGPSDYRSDPFLTELSGHTVTLNVAVEKRCK